MHSSRFVRDELCRWLARRFGVDPPACESGATLRDILGEHAPGLILVDRRIATDPESAVGELASTYDVARFVVLDERCDATTRAQYRAMGLHGCVSSAGLESYLESHLPSDETLNKPTNHDESILVGEEQGT